MGAANSTTLGVFGYLPGQPDFVRVRATGREIRRLEDWIERGLHQARWEMGGGFSVAYPRLFHRFVFRPDNCERVVLGVLCASVDSHQRPFPFVAFELIQTTIWDRDPAAFIERNGAFFASLETLVRAIGSLSHIGQIHGQVVSAQVPLCLDEAPLAVSETGISEAARYLNFLQETTCGDLGSPGAPGLALCHDLLGILGNCQDPRLLRQALAVSLSRPLFARELELRFYLSLLLGLIRAPSPTLTLFWQLGGAAPGSLLLGFREPTIDVFSALLRQGGSSSRGVYHPGVAVTPSLRSLAELTDATSLHRLLALIGNKQQHSGSERQGKVGT
jgi:type VI secretion system ImpM family protein